MPGDFYFAYDYDGKTASRLYRFVGGQFERYNPELNVWNPAPEQSCIFIGEDIYYDEITEQQAMELEVKI